MDGETQGSISKLTSPTSTVVPAVIGGLLCWLALPPVGWSLLAWVGPVPWLLLVAQKRLPGRRPYWALWLGGFVFWLLAAHWIRLPHPLNYLAWLVLAAYLGIYLPTFVAIARVGVHRLRLPLWLIAPIVWTGLDWFRSRIFTGFLMGSLAHTQAENTLVIQIADLAGEYGVTFLIVLVAASITRFLTALPSVSEPGRPRPQSIKAALHLLPAIIALAATLSYGYTRISGIEQRKSQPGPRIALIQGNTLADWKSDPGRQRQIMDEHVRLSLEAVKQSQEQDGRKLDLVIWPETAFREMLITIEEGYTPPPGRIPPENLTAAQNYLKMLTHKLGTALLVGITRVHVFPDAQREPDHRAYNSSVLVGTEGHIVGTYDKMHRVPFGEYIPFADWFPALYRLTPLTGGIVAGKRPAGLWLNGVLYCPNICYETAVPHLIRRQVLALTEQTGASPDVLVNLTNDAWYWGSSELDMHLACGVFRAVEMRIPLVIAANGGLSGYIDAAGNLQQVTTRQEPTFLIVDVNLSHVPASLYSRWGDWLAILCVLCCIVLAIIGWRCRAEVTSLKKIDDPARR